MKKVALFVGANRYPKPFKVLSSAVSDASTLEYFFGEYFGFEVHCKPCDTTQEVLDAIKNYTQGLKNGDLFVFYFAGHGYSQPDNNNQMLVLPDTHFDKDKNIWTGIVYNDLVKMTSDGGYDRVFMLDACRNVLPQDKPNQNVNDRGVMVISRDLIPNTTSFDYVENAHSEGAYALIQSCQAGETAIECTNLRGSVFSLALQRIISSAFDCKRKLTLNNAFRNVLENSMFLTSQKIKTESGTSTIQKPDFAFSGKPIDLYVPSEDAPDVTISDFVKTWENKVKRLNVRELYDKYRVMLRNTANKNAKNKKRYDIFDGWHQELLELTQEKIFDEFGDNEVNYRWREKLDDKKLATFFKNVEESHVRYQQTHNRANHFFSDVERLTIECMLGPYANLSDALEAMKQSIVIL